MRYYLGIDIGGSKIKAVLLNGLNLQKPKLFVIDNPKNRKEFFKVLERLIYKVLGGKQLAGIGVGAPGLVERERGVLIKAANLPFLNGWNVKKFFAKYSSRVLVDNDSRCFLRGEALWGIARGYKNVVGVALGTGIGGGVIIGGKMYYGKNDEAGEVGHQMLQIQNSKFKVKSFEDLAGRKAFEKGDQSYVVGIGVANLIRVLNPDMVVLGGGGISSGKVRLKTVRRFAKKYIMSPRAKNTQIVKGKLGDAAQAIGAALLFLGR